jgi:hypothetical protein
MPVDYYLQSSAGPARNSNEIQLALRLLHTAFSASRLALSVAVNVRLSQQIQLDLVIVGPDGLVLVDLESCQEPISGSVDTPWRQCRSGARAACGTGVNPYREAEAVCEMLQNAAGFRQSGDQPITPGGAASREGYPISAALVVAPHVPRGSEILLPQAARSWFRVVGIRDLVDLVFTSFPFQTGLDAGARRGLLRNVFHCQPWTDASGELNLGTHHGAFWLLEDAERRSYAIPIDGSMSIGRSRENDIVIPGRYGKTSRYHAQVEPAGTALLLKDAGSRHATFVNGKAVTGQLGYPLQEGDLIALGAGGFDEACHLCFTRQISSTAE